MPFRLSRRAILLGLPSAVACPSLPTMPIASDWTPSGEVDVDTFPWAPRGGDPAPDGLVIVAHSGADEVELALAVYLGDRWHALPRRGPFRTVGGVVLIEVDGLSPATPCAFVVVTPDGERRSEISTFRTAPASDSTGRIRIGATSCLGNADPTLAALQGATGADLDAMVLLGDTIYTQVDDLDGYRGVYAKLFDRAAFADLARSTPLVAMWDDHEVANNWFVGSPRPPGQNAVPIAQVDAARTAFREALPMRGDGDRLYRSVRFGHTLELILLDARSERTFDTIVAEEQLAWAIAALRGSPCRFKIVVSGVHVTDHAERLSEVGIRDVVDRWQGYPDQRDRLVEAAREVPGTLFLTGDMHYGGLQRVDGPKAGETPLWEIAAGPAGSTPWDIGGWLDDQGFGRAGYDLLLTDHNVAILDADPDAGMLTVEWLGPDGESLAAPTVLEIP